MSLELRLVLLPPELPLERCTEVNNSTSKKSHPLLTHSPAPRRDQIQQFMALKSAVNESKATDPGDASLPQEITELQITGRREQRENKQLPRQDGWAGMAAAYARACTWHGQPGKERAGGDGITL